VALGVLSSAESASVHRIARAREVGQPALAAVWGTLRGFLHALSVVHKEQPGLLLVNGPGTCIPVCAAAVLLRGLGLAPADLTIVFLESVCRVDSLSVSGHLAYWLGLADIVAVQWQQLHTKYRRTHFVGLQV
jgi:beta-1,4-N-acetylglucosaminyltransferase